MNSKTCFWIHIVILSWTICLVSFKGAAQTTKHIVDSIATDFLARNHSSCIVIGIIDHGEQKIYCYGNINKNGGPSADSNTLFEIGSLTKLFTATATAIEVHSGKLKYSDSLSSLLPGIHMPEYAGHEIKVIDLLHHTSGLPRIPTDLFIPRKNFDTLNPYAIYSRTNLDSFIDKYRLRWMPGTSYSYSNLGYGLMGDILSRIEGKSYESIIGEMIWKPLNMNHSTITLSEEQKKVIASPYNQKGEPDHLWDFDALAGAGAIRSDITDMMKFLSVSMNPGGVKDIKLKNALIDCQTMLFNADNGVKVGLGWHSQPFNYDRLIFHAGGTGGYHSFIGFTKNSQKGIIMLTNSQMENDEIALNILARLSSSKN